MTSQRMEWSEKRSRPLSVAHGISTASIMRFKLQDHLLGIAVGHVYYFFEDWKMIYGFTRGSGGDATLLSHGA